MTGLRARGTRYRNLCTLLLCLCWVCGPACLLSGVARADRSQGMVSLDSHYWYWVDQARDTSLTTLLQTSPDWQDNLESPSRALYRQAPLWMLFEVQNPLPDAQDYLLELESPMLDTVDLYQVDIASDGTPVVVSQQRGGDHHPLIQHSLAQGGFVGRFITFPVRLASQTPTRIYLRVDTTSALIAPVRLWQPQALYRHEISLNLYYGAFFGVMAVMAIYNLVLWFFIREHAYLYYVCYVVSAMFFQAVMSGYGYRYLWTDYLWLKDNAITLGVALCFIFAIAFVVSFLRLRDTDPPAYRWSLAGMTSYLILIWISPSQSEATLTSIAQPLGLILCVFAVWASLRQWRNGSQVATFFVVGWTLLVLGTAVYTLMLAGWLPHNLLTRHIQEIGMLAEVVLLSFALAARINDEKQARRLALETSLGLAQQVNDAYQTQIETQAHMTRELEARVAERTSDLQKALAELNEANLRLEQLSLTDVLTGLHNRRYLDRHLTTWMEFARKQGVPLAALVIDVDHFKKINDTYGHLIGDQCLKAVAASIKATVHRPDDLVVRYGGEEFVVVLRNTEPEGAQQVAERVRQNIEKARWEWEGHQVPVTISVGLAMYQATLDIDPETLLARADEALYAAKQTGRNRVIVAEAWLQTG